MPGIASRNTMFISKLINGYQAVVGEGASLG
jgi:hypothetical protein